MWAVADRVHVMAHLNPALSTSDVHTVAPADRLAPSDWMRADAAPLLVLTSPSGVTCGVLLHTQQMSRWFQLVLREHE